MQPQGRVEPGGDPGPPGRSELHPTASASEPVGPGVAMRWRRKPDDRLRRAVRRNEIY